MDVGLLAVLVTIYKAAEKTGLLDHLKSMPEKSFDALYEKFIQDHAAQNKFLKPLFTPKIEKAFNKAIKTIVPEHTPLRRELFLLAILTEPEIAKLQENLSRGELPTRALLLPIFQRALGKDEVSHLVDIFVDELYSDISKNQEVVNLVMLALVEKMSGQYQLLVEIRNKIGAGEIEIPHKEHFKIFVTKLPTTSGYLFGREKELKLLDAAWTDPNMHVLTLVAWGGVGKTALVNEWLNHLEKDNYRGAERVYGWSFYSQGTREDKNVSADEFLAHALSWFGYAGEPPKSQWDKGVKLAELVRRQKALLILDGLEPLQYPPGAMHGHLKDQGVHALLKELARSNPGLCVVTTRVAVKDIAHVTQSSAPRVDLDNLSAEAGAELLKHLKLNGTIAERRAAAEDFKGHALALNLLGSYLAAVHNGEIRKRDLIPHLTEEEEHGGHARRVMESYERWLQNTPELDLLYLMGLFDRPAAKGAIDALLAPPAIAGLTANLQNLPFAKLQFVLRRLRDLRLLAEEDENHPDGDRASRGLDCHPLVREHFGEELRQQNPAAWKEAHSRLYEYYKKLPAKELPDTLEEMDPLFAAVAHGCQAGRHQEALEDVYQKQIRRYNKSYIIDELSAFGADLSALSNFFEVLWNQAATNLAEYEKGSVFNWAGFALRAVGRIREASQPTQASLELRVMQNSWISAAKNAGNLCEIYLTLGEVYKAVAFARLSVDFADRSEDDFRKIGNRTTLADALHQSGELAEAEKYFREAEVIQQQIQPEHPYLYSIRGFRFCDLLLSQRQYQEVKWRTDKFVEWRLPADPLLSIALENLSIGCTSLSKATSFIKGENSKVTLDQTQNYLQQAVDGLREAGRQDHLPRALFARAAYYRSQNEFALAWADLEEGREIAERGEMKLFLADYHLEASKLQMAGGKKEEAQEHLAIAKEMIEKMGYGRRRPEVEELWKQLQFTQSSA